MQRFLAHIIELAKTGYKFGAKLDECFGGALMLLVGHQKPFLFSLQSIEQTSGLSVPMLPWSLMQLATQSITCM